MSNGQNHHRKHLPIRSRTVCFYFKAPGDIEGETDSFLRKELEDRATPVWQYGVVGGTDGSILWVEGLAGASMRSVLLRLKGMGWQARSHNEV